MKTKYLLIMLLLLTIIAKPALACRELIFDIAYEHSDVAFVGVAKEITELPKTDNGHKPMDVTFEVSKTLKGESSKIISVINTGKNCRGFPKFTVGEEYLVFAKEKDGRFETKHPMPNTELNSDFSEQAEEFVTSTETIEFDNFTPAGWKSLYHTQGDLNNDGQDDLVLVFEKDDPAYRKTNSSLGPKELNLNPRRLQILFQTDGDYEIALITGKFIPSQHDADSTCLADPFAEGGGIEVSEGLLTISLNYWLSCGSYSTSWERYVFRFENNHFRLIERNSSNFSRNTGDYTEYRLDYLTGKVKITEGLNEFEQIEEPIITWKDIKDNKPRYLDEMLPSSWVGDEY